jgi:predicted phosphodiesterase
MRVAVVSDIHGNLTAFEAVLADIRRVSPDLVLHGGDLADSGSSPVEIVDRMHELGWRGVMGNTDEMLVRPESLEDFAAQSSAPAALWSTIRGIGAATRAVLGEKRVAWLRELPPVVSEPGLALVHASPQSCWRAPAAEATDEELESVYDVLGRPVVAFGHTHRPSIRLLPRQPRVLINVGSVGLPFDGDPRASYLLLDGDTPEIRRVEYDMEKEPRALARCGLPGAECTASMLRTSSQRIL